MSVVFDAIHCYIQLLQKLDQVKDEFKMQTKIQKNRSKFVSISRCKLSKTRVLSYITLMILISYFNEKSGKLYDNEKVIVSNPMLHNKKRL